VPQIPAQTPPRLQTLFWGWDAPVIQKAVAFLTEGWEEKSALDLSDTLILVPNAEAARRLREALARRAGAAFIPHVGLPETILMPPAERIKEATALQTQLAWHRALEQADLENLDTLFPKLPARRGWAWLAETARMLAELQSLLGAGGWTFEAVSQAAPAAHDAPRWRELAALERFYLRELQKTGLRDVQQTKRTHAATPILPAGIRRVVVMPSPDLPPLMDRWLEACGASVTVIVHAPKDLAQTFDAFGHPKTFFWGEDTSYILPIEDRFIHVTRDPAAQSAAALDLLRKAVPQGRAALGVCDAEVASLLHEKLELEGAHAYEPGGVPVHEDGLWHLLSQMQALIASGSWKAFASLLRIPEVRGMLVPDASATRLLAEADAFAAEHLPVTLHHAAEFALDLNSPLHVALSNALKLVDGEARQSLSKTARQLILQLYGERIFHPEAPGHRERTELAAEWLALTEEIERETARFDLKPSFEEAFALSLERLAQGRLAEPRGEIDLVLQGWLELLWEPAPHLIVTGMNEEHVPGIFISHPFLPDTLREELGLPCQATRFARDAAILATLAHQRQAGGSLHVLCGQWSEAGDALRPSRLLFLCGDKQLPGRVTHLFPKEDEGGAPTEPARTLAWSLEPRVEARPLEHISPSRLKSYLACPFRYHLEQNLRMSPVDPAKRELDALDFGNLIHHAFHQFASDAALAASKDAKEIADALVSAAEARMHELHGRRPAPFVLLQFESVRQRLRQAALLEAAHRTEGWRIYFSEFDLGKEQPLQLDGVALHGRIDRVERNERSGQLRLIDFKTGDKPRTPLEAHLKKVTGSTRITEADEWKCFDAPDGSRQMWLDLQLPLYALAMQHRGLRPDALAYFVLPKSIQETALIEWENLSPEILDAALACATEAVRRICKGKFWPPNENLKNDPFAEMFLGDVVKVVSLEAAQKLSGNA
jgi:ATP-dependent helicase/nuclease subunit B